MAVKKNHQVLVKKLTKQVRILERKEEKGRRRLSAAIKKIRKLGRTYKSKLANKLRVMKAKIADAKTSTYVKVAANLERKMLQSIKAKGKALALAIAKIEKKHVAKLTKSVAKKGKKAGKVKKAATLHSPKINRTKRSGKRRGRKRK